MWHTKILFDQLTLSQPRGGGGTDYALQIILAPPDFRPSYYPELLYLLLQAQLEFFLTFILKFVQFLKIEILDDMNHTFNGY